MSLFSTIGSYEDAWKAIIMPFRQEYSLYDLGPTEFNVKDNRIKRADFRLLNKQGQVLECSYFQQANIDTPVPCVVYLHGNGCSRIEALSYTNLILSQPVSFFCFDFRGCGKSDGEYTSVGWHEQEDLECVIQYLCNTGKVSKVAVWGRSMGAVTAILYANKDPRIDCFILDSPFSNFKQLVKELAKQKAFIPGFLVTGAFGIIRKTILKKANFDIDALRPIKYVDKIKIPALFGAAKDDSFVAAKHTKDLYMAYGGPKQLMLFDGDHNSQRPFNWMILVQDFIKTHLLGEKSEPQHVAKPFKQAVNPAEKPMESPVEPKIELNANTNQNAAKEVTPVRKAAPVQKPQFQTQMSFSWLDHSASSPNLVVKSPSQPSFSDKAEKEPAVEEKLQHETMIPSEKRLQNLFAGKKENIPVRPPQFTQQSQTPKSALINLDITPKSSNKSDKSPTLKEHSKPPLKFALKENYGPGEKENGERLVKNTSSINLSSNSNISIFGPKKREIHSENIIGSPLRHVLPPKSNISLKEISSFQLNNASNIEAGATTPHQKVNATTIVEQDKSPVQKPNMSNLEIPMSSVQQSRSREHKNLTLIPNMLPLPLRKVDSQRDPKRIFDTGAQTSKDKTASTRSPNKSFTIDLKNLKLTKENSSPTPKQKGLVLQVKLNSDIPIISPHQAGSNVNLSYLTHSLNNVKQMDSRRNSETIAKSYNGLPGAENVKPSTGIFNEPKGYRDNMKLPVNLMENPIIKFSSELPPKGPQREVRKRHELVK